jgi:hypothetical protein
VPIKTPEQQSGLVLHRTRHLCRGSRVTVRFSLIAWFEIRIRCAKRVQTHGMYYMPFQKDYTHAMKGPMRHDTTIELITQLNEMTKYADGSKRTKLHRLIKNLIAKATTADDVVDTNGNIIKEGTGDLSAIQKIINRLEGKPSQKIVGPDNGPVKIEYKTIEEVRMFLLEASPR